MILEGFRLPITVTFTKDQVQGRTEEALKYGA